MAAARAILSVIMTGVPRHREARIELAGGGMFHQTLTAGSAGAENMK